MVSRATSSCVKWLAVFVVGPLAGCTESATTPTAPSEVAQKAERETLGRHLLASGADMLDGLDSFVEGGSDFRETTTEDAVKQTVRRLNEGLALLDACRTDDDQLTVDDGKVLREIVWLRDAARFAVGDTTDPLARAEKLFDWTVRNIQLIPDDAPAPERLPFLPWHTLVFGKGTALDRAWLFQLLARQQGLDVVLLAYADTKDVAAPHWWCPALVLDAASGDGKAPRLHLFEPRWGVPIPGPRGQGVATLEQVAGDDKLLRALDIDAEHPYPVKSADLKRLVALVETSSVYRSPRFAKLEQALSGQDKLVLSFDHDGLSAKLKQAPQLGGIVDWPLRDVRYSASREKEPYDKLSELLRPFNRRPTDLETGRTIGLPPLWRARVRHVSGKYYENMAETDPELRRLGINRWYQVARPAEDDLGPLRLDTVNWEYIHRMKGHATYWLGLVAYDLGNYDTATTFLKLILADPTNVGWVPGARYNLGRTYEAQAAAARDEAERKRLRDEAAAVYRKTFQELSPDAQCLWRAKSLTAR